MKTWIAAIVVVVYIAGYTGAEFGKQFQFNTNDRHQSILEKY